MITKEAILDYLRSIKPDHEKEGIVIHGIFGSFARDEASENSDIDVLIETTPRFVEDTDPLRAFSILQALREEISHRVLHVLSILRIRQVYEGVAVNISSKRPYMFNDEAIIRFQTIILEYKD